MEGTKMTFLLTHTLDSQKKKTEKQLSATELSTLILTNWDIVEISIRTIISRGPQLSLLTNVSAPPIISVGVRQLDVYKRQVYLQRITF